MLLEDHRGQRRARALGVDRAPRRPTGAPGPRTTRSSVDLPQPLGPTRHRNSPAATSSEIRSRARTGPPCPLKATLTSLSWTLGRPPPAGTVRYYPTPPGGATHPRGRLQSTMFGQCRNSSIHPVIALPWPLRRPQALRQTAQPARAASIRTGRFVVADLSRASTGAGPGASTGCWRLALALRCRRRTSRDDRPSASERSLCHEEAVPVQPRGRRAVGSAVGLGLSLLVLNPLAAGATDKPDLVVSTLSDPPATARAGDSFALTATVKNQGQAAAVATTTKFYLVAGSTRVRTSRACSRSARWHPVRATTPR